MRGRPQGERMQIFERTIVPTTSCNAEKWGSEILKWGEQEMRSQYTKVADRHIVSHFRGHVSITCCCNHIPPGTTPAALWTPPVTDASRYSEALPEFPPKSKESL